MPDTIGSSVPPPRVLPGARARGERSPQFESEGQLEFKSQ